MNDPVVGGNEQLMDTPILCNTKVTFPPSSKLYDCKCIAELEQFERRYKKVRGFEITAIRERTKK